MIELGIVEIMTNQRKMPKQSISDSHAHKITTSHRAMLSTTLHNKLAMHSCLIKGLE